MVYHIFYVKIFLYFIFNIILSFFIVITDGVFSIAKECNNYDNLIMLLNREEIELSIIKINSRGDVPDTPFGYISDTGMTIILLF